MPMNKSFRIVILLVSVMMLGCVAAEAQSRIATVELTQIFEKYWKTKRARLALADRKADLKKDLDSMNEAHKNLIKEYQKLVVDANDQAVSSEERDKRKKQVESKLKEVQESEATLKQFVSRGDAELDQQMRRMMDDVISDIRKAVAAKGKAGGYSFVIDASAEAASTKAPVLLYNSGESDLTAVVIDQLNAGAPPEPAGVFDSSAEKTEKK
jgi:Skp family chaperone for outer membrane proteins